MNKKNITIICLDSLEYEIVKKFNLKFYKQKYYGKLEVPIEESNKMPTTPVVWSSFMTGKNKEDHKINNFYTYRFQLINVFLKNFIYKYPKINKITANLLGKLNFQSMVRSLGMRKKITKKEVGKTFFDDYESKIISFPCYNEDSVNYEIRKKLLNVLSNKLERKEYEKLLLRAFEDRLSRLSREINKHELLCIHFFILDAIQHVYYNDEETVLKWYKFIEKKLSPIVKKLKGYVFIISDHGAERGVHTNYGFWSSNKVELGKIHIKDFYKVLEKL